MCLLCVKNLIVVNVCVCVCRYNRYIVATMLQIIMQQVKSFFVVVVFYCVFLIVKLCIYVCFCPILFLFCICMSINFIKLIYNNCMSLYILYTCSQMIQYIKIYINIFLDKNVWCGLFWINNNIFAILEILFSYQMTHNLYLNGKLEYQNIFQFTLI